MKLTVQFTYNSETRYIEVELNSNHNIISSITQKIASIMGCFAEDITFSIDGNKTDNEFTFVRYCEQGLGLEQTDAAQRAVYLNQLNEQDKLQATISPNKQLASLIKRENLDDRLVMTALDISMPKPEINRMLEARAIISKEEDLEALDAEMSRIFNRQQHHSNSRLSTDSNMRRVQRVCIDYLVHHYGELIGQISARMHGLRTVARVRASQTNPLNEAVETTTSVPVTNTQPETNMTSTSEAVTNEPSETTTITQWDNISITVKQFISANCPKSQRNGQTCEDYWNNLNDETKQSILSAYQSSTAINETSTSVATNLPWFNNPNASVEQAPRDRLFTQQDLSFQNFLAEQALANNLMEGLNVIAELGMTEQECWDTLIKGTPRADELCEQYNQAQQHQLRF